MDTARQETERFRILICYAARRDSTARIAHWLADGITGADVDVLEAGEVQSLDYDLVVLGSPIRIGRIHPDMVRFMDENREKLSAVPKMLFVVCLGPFLGRRYLEKMRRHVEGEVRTYRVFGGKFGPFNMTNEAYVTAAGKTLFYREDDHGSREDHPAGR